MDKLNVSSEISWPLISFKVKFAIFTIHIIHKRLCCQLSTFIITLFHPVLFYITHGDGWGLVLINSAAPRLLAHSCWGISPIQVLVSHPYTQRHLTHTPNGVSLINFPHNSTSSHKTLFRHLRSCLLVSTTASHSSSPLRPFRHLLSSLLVYTTSSHSSSLLCHTRNLRFVTLVISASSLPSSPSSDARHLQALTLVISREITTEALERTFLSLLCGC